MFIDPASVSRRRFVQGLAATTLLTGCDTSPRGTIPGRILGANVALGHRLRDGGFPPFSREETHDVVVVGGGMAGLAAARRLKREGVEDVILLELESEVGGNSASGENAVSAYPWGAHYVPIPGGETHEVTRLFEELGIITGHDAAGLPVYREEYVCADPEERLFLHGRWQEGLVPRLGVTPSDHEQITAFLAEMERLRTVIGSDGRPAFCIPLDRSSQDESWRRWDAVPMSRYLDEHGWDAAPLRWYVDYCCRDDFGSSLEQTSAWAGLHYFAARTGRAANADPHAVLTWPEGNGWIVKRLREDVTSHVRTACVALNIEPEPGRAFVDAWHDNEKLTVRHHARHIICATPRFIANRLIRPLRESYSNVLPPAYAPWAVANLTLDYMPGGDGMPLCWDNVIHASPSLGYIVATHQKLDAHPLRTVITWYSTFSGERPLEARARLLTLTHADWADLILADLERPHPGLRRHVRNLDVWVWGHGMVCPVPGFLWSETRRAMQAPCGAVVFAHSDMSGMALFEEAFIRGEQAAQSVLQRSRQSVG